VKYAVNEFGVLELVSVEGFFLSEIMEGTGGGSALGIGTDIVKLYYHADRLGTTDFMTSNTNGKVISYVSYDDWGALTAKAVLKAGVRELDLVLQYTVHPFDQVLGVYFAQARMYDAADRRFMAVDLIGINIANTMTYNKYAYAWNNPLRLVDLFGLLPERIDGAIVAVTARHQAGTIANVWMMDEVVYVDFFEALIAYGVTGVSRAMSGSIPSANNLYRAVFAFVSSIGSATFRIVFPGESPTSPVAGQFFGLNMGATGTPRHLVTLQYFHRLMCRLAWAVNSGQPVVKLPGDPALRQNDFRALAELLGRNSYQTRNELLGASTVEIVARTIYGEHTSAHGQLAVAWSMVNRVLAQRHDIFSYDGKRSSLITIATKPGAFSALDAEGGNRQSFTAKTSSDAGWLNAVTLAKKMSDVLDRYYPSDPYPHDTRARIRSEVSATIGDSPIGGATHFRTTSQFNHLHRTRNGTSFYMNHEIFDIYHNAGHSFFNYREEAPLSVGL